MVLLSNKSMTGIPQNTRHYYYIRHMIKTCSFSIDISFLVTKISIVWVYIFTKLKELFLFIIIFYLLDFGFQLTFSEICLSLFYFYIIEKKCSNDKDFLRICLMGCLYKAFIFISPSISEPLVIKPIQ